MSLSSRGLGLRAFNATTWVRIPLGTPKTKSIRETCFTGYKIFLFLYLIKTIKSIAIKTLNISNY